MVTKILIVVLPIFLPAESYYYYAARQHSSPPPFLSMEVDYSEDKRLETLQDASLRSGLSPRYIASHLTHPIHSQLIDRERYYRRVFVDILVLNLTENSEVYS